MTKSEKFLKMTEDNKVYPVDRVMKIIKDLSGENHIAWFKDGMRLSIGGYPANIEDHVNDGTIDLVAVDADAAKGIKGALMKAGIMSTIFSGKTVSINAEPD